MKGRVLIIAGSDSGGGAGIQADIKTVTAFGAYAATAITALTAQNTLGVSGVLAVAPDFVRRQIDAVLDDIGADCIKTGMLADAAVIEAAAAGIAASAAGIPVVVDPVMIATSGTRLLAADAMETLRHRLIARSAVLTPNLPEAEMLLGRDIATLDEMRRACEDLLAWGPGTVVLKGGHLAGERLHDVVAGAAGNFVLSAPRVATRHTHGTGCTHASAIAAGIAQGSGLREAIERAHAFVQQAIRTAPGFGRGKGPLNHAATVPGADGA